MTNRKNNNSMIFLATLGVYFGLVLVGGAAPQVYAHGAMTRNFELKDEIEVKDDLDTKPDDERSPVTASVQIYLEDVEYFLTSLGRLKSKGQFDPNADTFNVVQNTMLPCLDSNLAGRFTPIRFDSTSESSRPALELFTRGMVYGYSLGDCIGNGEFHVSAVDSRFNFHLDREAFSVNVAVKKQSPQIALNLLREMESTLKLYSGRGNSKLLQRIIENTSFKAENDQVFIVTRLPRAGLDSLLAKDAK
ncbi:MAG: hypothetical protein H7070_07660 [Saprospiraceae bacterium]|nr:hypothetical protein [Pyrinomonadaceae bacterium]